MAEVQKFSKVKLVDLSLKCIIKNFGRYIDARAAGDTIPARNFYFLQKLFSKQLFRELANTKYFVENMEFFLNPYLKEVDLDLCHHDSDITEIIERLKVIGETIMEFNISNMTLYTDVLLEITQGLTNVRFLTVHARYAGDNLLQNIGKYCILLETLCLLGNSFTDAGIELFCQVTESNGLHKRENHPLKSLIIRETAVTAVGVASVLKKFPNITNLDHEAVIGALYIIYTDIKRNNIPRRFEIFKLDELYMHNLVSNSDLNFLRMCTSLCPLVTQLHIHRITLQTQLDAVQGFQKLKTVNMSVSKDVNLSTFFKLQGKYLEDMCVLGGKMSVESLVTFCPNLKSLEFCNTAFESEINISCMSGFIFQKLEQLSFTAMHFEADNITKSVNVILSSSSNLKILKFKMLISFTLKFVNSIADYNCMKTIQEIHLIATGIEFPAAKQLLLATPNLNLYKIRNCSLKIAEYEALQKLRSSIKFICDNLPRPI